MKSLSLLLFALVCVGYVSYSIAAKNRTGVETIETRMLSDLSVANNEKLTFAEPTLQERLDTIVKAFQRLPPNELERFGVDLSVPIIDGTPEAVHLLKSWNDRQTELKNAMKSMMQPAELMGKLTQQLKDTDLLLSEREQALIDLESLLADIDNARDFHTIGSWPVLVSLLTGDREVSIRTLAAWAVGTAVKNSYDYQLWVLEPVEVSHSTNGIKVTQVTNALQLLLDNLEESHLHDGLNATQSEKKSERLTDLQKRLLYAISSAVRGNLDVQGYILDENINQNALSSILHSLATTDSVSVTVQRKVWSFIEDLLQEMHYIRQELNDEVSRLLVAESSSVNVSAVEVGMDGDVKTSLTPLQLAVENVRNMQLLGDVFVSDVQWLSTASDVLRVKVTELLTIVAGGRHTVVTIDDEGEEQVITVLGQGMDKNHVIAVQSITRSILNVLTDVLKLKSSTAATESSEEFKAGCSVVSEHRTMATLQDISILNGDEMFEELIPLTQELMGVLSLCSVSGLGSGSSNI